MRHTDENSLSTAPGPSYVTLPQPDGPLPSLLEFLDARFPYVGRDVWRARLETGKVTDDAGCPMTLDTPYRPHLRLRYYREVPQEPVIPFKEEVIFQNDQVLVVCKPHFLPVTPAGPYVNECLLSRLKAATGIDHLVPIHRIDRETAGLVMFSLQKETRGQYHELFSSGRVRKVYEAIATLPEHPEIGEWRIKSRIERGSPWFRVKNTDGPVNAVSLIRLLDRTDRYGYFQLEPLTGKQHQLRAHLSLIGSQILYDRYYPALQPKRPDDFQRPLQLLARELRFTDPITRTAMRFRSTRALDRENVGFYL